ncbi:unnamed protein product [Cylicocyclus nassatus]|uniref:Major sperm protein n=1 Tax=Cylicocyclus nassatus TaxID=53992 RepID=A0AA36GL12_CYLNA|nr:unnamed protein product [Cylicocyclus nassatus]
MIASSSLTYSPSSLNMQSPVEAYRDRRDNCVAHVYLSTREVLILATMCGFAAFNMHGTDAKSFFNVFTLVPALLFSFKILVMNKDNTTLSVGIVSMFWMYYGMGVICDVFFSTGEGYMAVQLLLVGALCISAYRGSLTAGAAADSRNGSSALNALSQSEILISERIKSSPRQKYHRDVACGDSQFLDEASTPTYSECELVNVTQTTENTSSATAMQIDNETAAGTMLTAIMSGTTTAVELFPGEAKTVSSTSTALHGQSLISESSVLVHYGDLLAEPAKMLQFQNYNDTQKITITNISNHTLVWTVKTNAIYEIGASPSQGILQKGAKAEIIVVLNADVPDVPDAVRHSDKLAIDYSYIEETRAKYKRRRMKPSATKRYQFDILYRF